MRSQVKCCEVCNGGWIRNEWVFRCRKESPADVSGRSSVHYIGAAASIGEGPGNKRMYAEGFRQTSFHLPPEDEKFRSRSGDR